jgi:hypothetical protein
VNEHRQRNSQGSFANAGGDGSAGSPGTDVAVADARPNSPVLFELPPVRGASLGRWLRCAAVVAEVCAEGVLVDARANRVFGSADLAMLVREWMQAHHVDTVFASSDRDLFSITP